MAKKIKIVIDDEGNISAKRTHLKHDKDVYWECSNPFVVIFDWNTPIGEIDTDVAAGEYVGLERVKGKASGQKYKTADVKVIADPGNGPPLLYKYSIIAYVDPDVLMEDPEIIIDP